VYINGAFFSYQLFQVIVTMKAKKINCFCLLVYNFDKAADAMVYKCCILMYAICKPCYDVLNIFVVTQVITSFTSSISSSNSSAKVQDKEKAIMLPAVVPSQWEGSMKHEWI